MNSLKTTQHTSNRCHRLSFLLAALHVGAFATLGCAQTIAPPVDNGESLINKIPSGILTDAELSFRLDPSKILADATASGGRGVVLHGDYDRFSLAVPAGSAFKIWVRHKNGPINLKSTKNGKETELKWVFESPREWTWSDLGSYERAELGGSIVLMRGPQNSNPDPQIDAVVFAPDTVRPLPPFEPDNQAAPLTINAEIAWDQMAGKMAPEMWGVNDYEILTPKDAADPSLQKFLARTHFPIIRIHQGGFTDRWTESATRDWNLEKIKAGFAASTGYGDAKIMMNIANWPGWLQGGNYLPPEKVDEYVALVGKLVVIMRDEVKHPIAYWELPNEKEAEYDKRGKLDELWSLSNKLSAEIKKQQPGAKVGGPAMSWPNPVWMDGFFKNSAPSADFISWHNYGFGSIYDSNETLFEKPAGFGSNARHLKELAAKYAPGREFGTFLTEYNVKWDWSPFERRHANNVGAVFMASTIREVGLSGITCVMHWHLKGNAYGMIDENATIRLPARLYDWGTHYLIGGIPQTKISDEKNLEILPIVRSDGAKSVLLINKANRTVKVPDGMALLPKKDHKHAWSSQLNASGYTPPHAVSAKGGELVLPGYSVTMLSTARHL